MIYNREDGADIMDFINNHYKTFSVARMYQSRVNPVPHPDEWSLPDEISIIKVIPPNKEASRTTQGLNNMQRDRNPVEEHDENRGAHDAG